MTCAASFAALVACSRQAPAHDAPRADPPIQNLFLAGDRSDSSSIAAPQGPQTGLATMPLTIRSRTGTHHFVVEIAATEEQQQRGLMFRKSLAPNRGMLFPYSPPQEVAFWMKNTLIPLDIVYIRADGTIGRIVHAQAMDLTPLPSGEPVSAVLEIAAGRAEQLRIKEGDHVRWRH